MMKSVLLNVLFLIMSACSSQSGILNLEKKERKSYPLPNNDNQNLLENLKPKSGLIKIGEDFLKKIEPSSKTEFVRPTAAVTAEETYEGFVSYISKPFQLLENATLRFLTVSFTGNWGQTGLYICQGNGCRGLLGIFQIVDQIDAVRVSDIIQFRGSHFTFEHRNFVSATWIRTISKTVYATISNVTDLTLFKLLSLFDVGGDFAAAVSYGYFCEENCENILLAQTEVFAVGLVVGATVQLKVSDLEFAGTHYLFIKEVFACIPEENDCLVDTDNDGFSNRFEESAGSLATNNKSTPELPEGHLDHDEDGLLTFDEVNSTMTDPFNRDHDGDSISDGIEITELGTDPLLADTDGDGSDDFQEIIWSGNPNDSMVGPQQPTPPVFTQNLPAIVEATYGQTLDLEVQFQATPIIITAEWYFSADQSDYPGNGTLVKEESSLSQKTNSTLTLDALNQKNAGYYWVKISPLFIFAPINSSVVAVNPMDVTLSNCDETPHGGSRSRKKFLSNLAYLSCQSQIQTSSCHNGVWQPFTGSYEFDNCAIKDCRLHEDPNCGDFDSLVVNLSESENIFYQNNIDFKITCPVGYRVYINDRTNIECTGSETTYELALSEGLLKFNISGFESNSLNPMIKTYPISIRNTSTLNPTIKGSLIENMNLAGYVKKRNIAEDLTSDLSKFITDLSQPIKLFSDPVDLIPTTPSVTWNSSPIVDLDFSGITWNQSQTATLISDRHVLYAAHWTQGVGSQVIFYDKDGNKVERNLLGLRFPIAGKDVAVGILDNPVPEAVKRYKFLSWENNIIDGVLALQATYNDHDIGVGRVAGGEGIAFGDNIHILYDTGAYSRMNGNIGSGDSGNPNFVVFNGELYLISLNGGVGIGGSSGVSLINQSIQQKIMEKMQLLNVDYP